MFKIKRINEIKDFDLGINLEDNDIIEYPHEDIENEDLEDLINPEDDSNEDDIVNEPIIVEKFDKVNEELIGNLLSKVFNKVKEKIRSTKGIKEVDAIYDKYKKTITNSIEKLLNKDSKKDANQEEIQVIDESINFLLLEAEVKNKEKIDNFLSKRDLINKLLEKNKQLASNEMKAVVEKLGGKEKNTKLVTYIESLELKLDIDVLNLQIKYLDKLGAKKEAQSLLKERKDKDGNFEDKMRKLNKESKGGESDFKVGDTVIYKRKKFDQKTWLKVDPENRSNINNKAIKSMIENDMVGVKKISSMKGNSVSFEDAKFTKRPKDLLVKAKESE